jgi:hypothetical protein
LLFIRSFPLAEAPFTALFDAVPLQFSTPERTVTVILSLLEYAPPSFKGEMARKQTGSLDVEALGPALVSVGQRCHLNRGMSLLMESMLIDPATYMNAIESVIGQLEMPSRLVDLIACGLKNADDDKAARRILAVMRERYPAQVELATASTTSSKGQRSKKPKVASVDVSMEIEDDEATPALVQVYSADASTRARGIERLVKQSGELSADDAASTTAALLARAADEDAEVLSALYNSPTELFAHVTPMALLEAISPVLYDTTTPKDTISRHLKFIRSWATLGYADPALLDAVFQKAYFPLLMWTKGRRETARLAWKVISTGHMDRVDVMNGMPGMPEYSQFTDVPADMRQFGTLNGKIVAKLAGKFELSIGKATPCL